MSGFVDSWHSFFLVVKDYDVLTLTANNSTTALGDVAITRVRIVSLLSFNTPKQQSTSKHTTYTQSYIIINEHETTGTFRETQCNDKNLF